VLSGMFGATGNQTTLVCMLLHKAECLTLKFQIQNTDLP